MLGPALLKLMRDPNKPPFNNAFREKGTWMVPPGGEENFQKCRPDSDEATHKRAFEWHDWYTLKFDDGEWKLKAPKNKLLRFVPIHSYGKSGLSKAHRLVGLSNFTTYTTNDDKATDYETKDFHLIVLHERANLSPDEWEEKGAAIKCYY